MSRNNCDVFKKINYLFNQMAIKYHDFLALTF